MEKQSGLILFLKDLMSLMDQLRENQSEPLGEPKDPGLEKHLKIKAANVLLQIETLSCGEMAHTARLRREWLLTSDRLRQNEIAKQVFALRCQSRIKDELYFDIGHLVNSEGMQDISLRQLGLRYAGWVYKRVYENIYNSNGTVIQFYNISHFSGEAKVNQHISNFWPEDAGILGEASDYTTIYSNVYYERYQKNVFPLLE